MSRKGGSRFSEKGHVHFPIPPVRIVDICARRICPYGATIGIPKTKSRRRFSRPIGFCLRPLSFQSMEYASARRCGSRPRRHAAGGHDVRARPVLPLACGHGDHGRAHWRCAGADRARERALSRAHGSLHRSGVAGRADRFVCARARRRAAGAVGAIGRGREQDRLGRRDRCRGRPAVAARRLHLRVHGRHQSGDRRRVPRPAAL